jgi:hypothetical protein
MQLSRIDVVLAVLLVGIVTIGNEGAVQRAETGLNLQALLVSLQTKNAGKLHLRIAMKKERWDLYIVLIV